jgi:DNA-binding HxlR family transcriptional regulator
MGERWTLLIVRELLLGPKRFGDLVERLSGVSPTVLTGRLNALIESGVVRRAALPAPFNAPTYELTPVGLALKPAIRELIRWGGNFLFPMRRDDTFEPDWVLLGLDAIARQTPTPARTIALQVTQGGKSASSFLVQGGPQGTTLSRGEGPASAMLETRFDTLLRIRHAAAARSGDFGEAGARRRLDRRRAHAAAVVRSQRPPAVTSSC